MSCQAGAELSRKFDADLAIVWTFALLIDDALHTLDADESDFVTRAAHERVREEKLAADLAVASEWLGYAQLAFALGGAEQIAAAVGAARRATGLHGCPDGRRGRSHQRREVAQRRLPVLADPGELLADFGPLATRAAKVSQDIDLGATMMQHAFLDRLRAVAALDPVQLTAAHRLLLSGRRKVLRVLGGEWADSWEPIFQYLRRHAVVSPSGPGRCGPPRRHWRACKTGKATSVRAAEQALRRAKRVLSGSISKVKGLPGEAYVSRCSRWKVLMDVSARP